MTQPFAGELLRDARTIEALKRIGNKEALELLQRLASGAHGFRVTEEARSSVERLQEKKKPREEDKDRHSPPGPDARCCSSLIYEVTDGLETLLATV